HFLVLPDSTEWISQHMTGPCRLLPCPAPPLRAGWKDQLLSLPGVPEFKEWLFAFRPVQTPMSDNTIEKAGIDVMHFYQQGGFLTSIPTISHPHDLKHVHLPQFFSKRQIQVRETYYSTLCNQARKVVVASKWVARDVTEHFHLPPDKVYVVNHAPHTAS